LYGHHYQLFCRLFKWTEARTNFGFSLAGLWQARYNCVSTGLLWPGQLPPGAGAGSSYHDYEQLYRQHYDPVDIKAAQDSLLSTKVRQYESLVEASYGQRIETVRQRLLPVEKEYLQTSPEFEAKFSSLYKRDKKSAQKLLKDYQTAIFSRMMGLYDRLLRENKQTPALQVETGF